MSEADAEERDALVEADQFEDAAGAVGRARPRRDHDRRRLLGEQRFRIEAVVAHTGLLLPRIELVAAQRRDAKRHLEQLLEALAAQEPAPGDQREHHDVAILRSMPGVGSRVAAAMLAEASQSLVDRAYHTLRASMGVAPVTSQSGRRRTVSMRYACNHRLRQAAYHWARTGMQRDAGSRAYYAALRARGHTHGRALRSVTDRLLRILVTLLKHGHLYNPEHRPSIMTV